MALKMSWLSQISWLSTRTETGTVYRIQNHCSQSRTGKWSCPVLHLQQCLNKLSHWADTNGFKFSSSKTVCIHFCRLRKLHPDPQLFLNGTPVPVVEETKFLGIIFDSKLSFLPHIRHLKDKCVKALNLLRILAPTSWGLKRMQAEHVVNGRTRLIPFCLCVASSAVECGLEDVVAGSTGCLLSCWSGSRNKQDYCQWI